MLLAFSDALMQLSLLDGIRVAPQLIAKSEFSNSVTPISSTLTYSVSGSRQWSFCCVAKGLMNIKTLLFILRVAPKVLHLQSIHGAWCSSQTIPRIRSFLDSKSRRRHRYMLSNLKHFHIKSTELKVRLHRLPDLDYITV